MFTVLIGAILFGYFLTITQTPQKVTEFLTGLGLGRYGILAVIMVMYLVLGCLMDALAMIILTVPIIFPVIKQLGFDPIWFGVIIVMTVELGLIHPPVGMNIFVIKSVVEDVKISTIFYGVLPFIITDILRLIILIAFPDHGVVAAVEDVSRPPSSSDLVRGSTARRPSNLGTSATPAQRAGNHADPAAGALVPRRPNVGSKRHNGSSDQVRG